MNILEIAWQEDGGVYTLALTWPDEAGNHDREEVGRILHRCGFLSLGADRWTAPDDFSAPLEMMEAFGRYGIATSMSLDTLPPILESKISRLPMF